MSAPNRTIYRVENQNGEGPYRAELSRTLPASLSNPYDKTRPSPVVEGFTYPPWPAYRSTFAFATPQQAIKWFGDAKHGRWLAKYGYYLASYTIPNETQYIYDTPHQVVFDSALPKKLVSKERIKYPETFNRLKASN